MLPSLTKNLLVVIIMLGLQKDLILGLSVNDITLSVSDSIIHLDCSQITGRLLMKRIGVRSNFIVMLESQCEKKKEFLFF